MPWQGPERLLGISLVALWSAAYPPPNASLGHLMDKLIWHFSCTPRGIPALCWSSHPGLRKHPRWLWRPTWEQALHPEGYGASFPKHTRSILGNSWCTLVFTPHKNICLCSHVSVRSSEDLVQRARTLQPIFAKALAPHRGWYKQGCIEEESRIAPFMALSRPPRRCASTSPGCLG